MGLFDKKYCDICGEKIGLLATGSFKTATFAKTVPPSFRRGSRKGGKARLKR